MEDLLEGYDADTHSVRVHMHLVGGMYFNKLRVAYQTHKKSSF